MIEFETPKQLEATNSDPIEKWGEAFKNFINNLMGR
jgi:hypothetical protein